MKKNKIIVAMCNDDGTRAKMVRKIAINLGFAKTETDAKKIVTPGVDTDLSSCYFILAETFSMRRQPELTHRLYRMASQGMAVVVGMRTVYPEHEFLCEVFTPDEIL